MPSRPLARAIWAPDGSLFNTRLQLTLYCGSLPIFSTREMAAEGEDDAGCGLSKSEWPTTSGTAIIRITIIAKALTFFHMPYIWRGMLISRPESVWCRNFPFRKPPSATAYLGWHGISVPEIDISPRVQGTVLLDQIDRVILSSLGKNARASSQEIAGILKGMGFAMTDRAVRQRLERLQKRKVILGYTTILNPDLVSEKVNRTILVKFKYSRNLQESVERLDRYVAESPFCIFAARLGGDFDWVCHFVFSSVEQYDLETNSFLNRFADLVSDFRSYESKASKSSPYILFDEHASHEKRLRVHAILNSVRKHDNLNDRLQAIVGSLVKYFDARFARMWFYDKKTRTLVLRYSEGKYRGLHGEFSRVPLNSLKIGAIAKTKRPVVSNDIAHDPRIKHHDWAKKEKLKSFAGYPILYGGEVVAVLAMFSQKALSPEDFEILGIFSDQVSRELSGFFETKDFLAGP